MNGMRPRETGSRAHERDERWAIVALVVLALAYIVYRVAGSGRFGIPEFDLEGIDLSELGRAGAAIPYVATVLIGVLTQVVKRVRNERARSEMLERASREGMLARSDEASWRTVSPDGEAGRRKSGAVVLSRAAVYILEGSGGAPSRFPFRPDEPDAETVVGATTRRGEGGVVLELKLSGREAGALRLDVPDTTRWVHELSKAAGRTVDAGEAAPPEDQQSEPEDDEDEDDSAGWMTALGI